MQLHSEAIGTHSFWRIATTILVIVCVLFVSVVPLSGNDFWMQSRIGEIIVRDRAIPSTLLFPFTEIANAKFNAHEWLASVVFHALLSVAGEELLPFLNGLLGLALFALMARLAFVRSANHYGIALIGGAMTLVAENYRHELRPELLSLLLMAAFWNLMEGFRRHLNIGRAAGLILLMVLWVNCHGSFVIGPILAGLYTCGLYLDGLRQPQRLQLRPGRTTRCFVLLTICLLCACFASPFGWELVRFVLVFSGDAEASKHLTEWIPTLDHRLYSLPGLWIGLIVWLALAVSLLLNFRRASFVDILVFIAFSFLAVNAIRFLVYLGMVFAFVASPYLAKLHGAPQRSMRSLQIMSLAMLVTICAAATYGNAAGRRPYYYDDPTRFTHKMRQVLSDMALQGNVLNTMELGAELTYRAYPRLRPAIDSRFDSYGTAYVDYIYSVLKSDSLFDAFVSRYDVRYVLMDGSRYADFTQRSSWKSGQWRVYHMDHRAVLFQRVDVHEGSPEG